MNRRKTSSRSGRVTASRGFTLVEMLAVVAIMGILFSAAVVGFQQFNRGAQLRSATRDIVNRLSYARQLAIGRNAVYGVEFDKDYTDTTLLPRFRVFWDDGSADPPTIGNWVEFPPGIRFGDENETLNSLPPDVIVFRPTGSVDGASTSELQFAIYDTQAEKERGIEVAPITGRPKTTE